MDSEMNESHQKQEPKKESFQESLLELLHDFAWMLVVLLLIFLLFFRQAIVDGSSMYKTLVDGDRLLMASNLIYPHYKQGDIVILHKKNFSEGVTFIKRVIATEGQTVDIDFEQGIVYVDGEALQEPYVNTPTNLDEGMVFPLTVPQNCVLAFGDNRNNSKDSRDPEVGFVDQREIYGKALLLFYPGYDRNTETRDFSRIGVIK